MHSRAAINNTAAIVLAVLAVFCILFFIMRSSRVDMSKIQPNGHYQLNATDSMAYMTGLTMGRIPFSAVINIEDSDPEQIVTACNLAWDALEFVNTEMNPYKSDSPLAKINSAEAGVVIEISPELYQILLSSRQLTEKTGGSFDPTCRKLFEFYKTLDPQGEFPSKQQISDVLKNCGWGNFELHETGQVYSVKKQNAVAEIDLGAIAKGFAADAAVEKFKAAGFAGALVEVGGEISVFGKPSAAKKGWVIGLTDPFAPDTLDGGQNICGKLSLSGKAAVATSGDYRRFTTLAGKHYSHIIDPRSGLPAEQTHSVTVIARDCEIADAVATALSVLGPESMDEIIEKIRAITGGKDALLEAMIVTGSSEDSHIFTTKNFNNYLVGPLDF